MFLRREIKKLPLSFHRHKPTRHQASSWLLHCLHVLLFPCQTQPIISAIRMTRPMDCEFEQASSSVVHELSVGASLAVENNDSGNSVANPTDSSCRRKRQTVAQRRLLLKNHPWISSKPGDFSSKSVRCRGCDKIIVLDKRWEWYTTAWDKHVFRCVPIRKYHFEQGMDMPFESLVAEVGREAAEKCRDEREEARANGEFLQLTSDSAWVKPARIPKHAARKSLKLKITRQQMSSIRSPSSDSTDSPSDISTSSEAPIFSSEAPPSASMHNTPSSSDVAVVDDIPFTETLSYQVWCAYRRILVENGYPLNYPFH
ncbi:hypothetical protein FB446DRAFT_751388 [Lentinula raphanica]|nr:hypothetical protein FB446DRAFT_751388 [Lentinula raphanica]